MLQGPATDRAVVRAIGEALAAERPFQAELLNYRKDGTPFWNKLSITPVLDTDGILSQFVGVQRDVTARSAAKEQLMLATRFFEQTSESLVVTDAAHNIVKVNAVFTAFTAISGCEEVEVLGRNPAMLRSGRHEAVFYESMWRSLTTSSRWQGEVWNRRTGGDVYPQAGEIGRPCDVPHQARRPQRLLLLHRRDAGINGAQPAG